MKILKIVLIFSCFMGSLYAWKVTNSGGSTKLKFNSSALELLIGGESSSTAGLNVDSGIIKYRNDGGSWQTFNNGSANYWSKDSGTSELSYTTANVGIGKTNPSVTLDVEGNTNIKGDVDIDGDVDINGDTNIKGDVDIDGNTLLDGEVEISKDTKINKKLTVQSEVTFSKFYNKNLRYLCIKKGKIFESNTCINSDIRLKSNIKPLENSLNKILHINGVSYNWKDVTSDSERELGLIAQEVEKEFPELVSADQDGFKKLNYTGLIAPLVEAIKSQQQQIDELKKELKELQKR